VPVAAVQFLVAGTFYDMDRTSDGYFTVSAPYGQARAAPRAARAVPAHPRRRRRTGRVCSSCYRGRCVKRLFLYLFSFPLLPALFFSTSFIPVHRCHTLKRGSARQTLDLPTSVMITSVFGDLVSDTVLTSSPQVLPP